MSGFTQPDPVRQLLGVLSDPATFKKQLADFAAAKDAAEKASSKLGDVQKALEADKAKHADSVERHNARVADFEGTKVRVLAIEQKFADREAAVAKREADLANEAKVHAQAVEDWERDYSAKKKELDLREKAAKELEEHLANLQLKLAAKEKELTTKLDRLREIAA